MIVTQQGERGLQLVLTDEEFAAFKKAQDRLAHVVRHGDPAVVVALALAHFAVHLEKRERNERARAPEKVARSHAPATGQAA
ncbi:MAG: hypothetical protein HZA61_14970 [Candidatus Eisenbacteria bacterium]|uniref:Uncharacterized protein n=1 Tax=Eiseniibacteriota bacterium TaxID=2212470 RepID=A0A933WBZ1_UNCEI|nr:hypothetical protein [Candidatus Eisenbacteria bacterium]